MQTLNPLDEATRAKFRVSVIIPVLNDFARLRLCLRALARQTWPQSQLDVLVVDNGSDGDVTSVTAEFGFARVFREAVPGSYAARNRGLEEVTGNIIAFTDSDCIPEPQWIEEGVRAVAAEGPKVVVGGRVVLFAEDPDAPTWAEDFELALGFPQRSNIEQKNYSVTANMFTTPHAFRIVGPFEQELKSGGDKQWGQRAHAAGIPLFYAENALIRHPARQRMRQLLRKRARVVGGHLGIAQQRYGRWSAFARLLLKSSLPPVRRVLRVRRTGAAVGSSAGPRRWKRQGRVLVVGVTLQAFSFAELIRLQFGGQAKR